MVWANTAVEVFLSGEERQLLAQAQERWESWRARVQQHRAAHDYRAREAPREPPPQQLQQRDDDQPRQPLLHDPVQVQAHEHEALSIEGDAPPSIT